MERKENRVLMDHTIQYIKRRHRVRKWAILVTMMSAVVGGAVYLSLRYHGMAMTNLQRFYDCPYEVHEHTKDCYTLDENGEEILICGLADYVVHVHNDDCYEEGVLICTLPEIEPHVHTEDCYRVITYYIDENGNEVEVDLSEASSETVEEDGETVEQPLEENEEAVEQPQEENQDATEQPQEENQEVVQESPEAIVTGFIRFFSGNTEDVVVEDIQTSEEPEQEAVEETASQEIEEAPAQETETKSDESAQEIPEAETEESKEIPEEETGKEATNEDTAQEETAQEETAQEETEEQEAGEQEAGEQETETQGTDLEEASETEIEEGKKPEIETDHREYFIKKILICDKLELHTHTDECYSEEGELICGLLQLEEHIHDKDCFTYEDQKKTRIAKANTLVHKSSHYSVTAKYEEDAMIPEEACFVVREITQKNSPEVYEESMGEIDALTDSDGYTLAFLLDIGFYIDEDEIEPQAPVDVTIELLDEEVVEQDSEVAIVHFDHEGGTTMMENTEVEERKTTFQTDSFSIYAVVVKKTPTEISAGKYGNYTFEFNKEENAFLKSEYYNPGNALGICGNFHIVAFDTARLQAHVNGNILVKNAYIGHNFGTNNLSNEVSYIQNYLQVTGNSGTSQSNVALALGHSAKITLTDNNFHLACNDTKLDSPYKIIQDVNSDMAPYVNLNSAKQELQNILGQISQHSNTNVTFTKGDNYNGNIDSFKLENPDAVGYYNITAEQFRNLSNNNVYLDGFSKGHYGSMIINVDCSGVSELTFPERLIMIIDGQQVNSQERTDFQSGKILWNFTHSDGLNINGKHVIGSIIAPNANITVSQNMDGTIIGNNVTITAETHRDDFTGTTVVADISARKLVNDMVPTQEQKFYFDLFTWDGSSWIYKEQKQNEYSNIAFSFEYTDSDAGKTFYYLLKESDANVDLQYEYDKSIYLFKISVGTANGALTKTVERYRVKQDASLAEIIRNGGINEQCLDSSNQLGVNDILFQNNTNMTSVSVEKHWLDLEGNPTLTDLPDYVVVRAVKCYYTEENGVVVEHREPTDQIAILSEENKWTYTFDRLPLYELMTLPNMAEPQIVPLYYFIEEIDVVLGKQTVKSKYKVTYSTEVPVKTGTIMITNQPITIEKEMELPLIVKKNWLNAADNLASGVYEKDISFELYQIQTPDPSSVYPKTEVLYGTYQITQEDLWKISIEKLPLENRVDGVKYTYSYYVKEIIPENSKYILVGYDWSKDSEEPLSDIPVIEEDGTLTIKNRLTVTDLEVQKYWHDSQGNRILASETTEMSINVKVYRTCAESMEETDMDSDVLIGEYILTPNSVSAVSQSDDSIEYAMREESDIKKKIPWSLHLTNLPACDTQGQPYRYYAVETKIGELAVENSAYTVSYSETPVVETVFEIHNTGVERFVLPETGGRGTIAYRIKKWFRKLIG